MVNAKYIKVYVQPRITLSHETLKKAQSQQLAKTGELKSSFFVSLDSEELRKSSNLQLDELSSLTDCVLASHSVVC